MGNAGGRAAGRDRVQGLEQGVEAGRRLAAGCAHPEVDAQGFADQAFGQGAGWGGGGRSRRGHSTTPTTGRAFRRSQHAHQVLLQLGLRSFHVLPHPTGQDG